MELSELGLTPLDGGWSGETFVAGSGPSRTVVRIYPGNRPPQAPEIDAALLALVRGLVPVPDVLEVRRGDPAADVPGLLVTSWVPGERGDLVLPGLDPAGRRRFGTAMGTLAATLAGMPTPMAGEFADARLLIRPFAPVEAGLVAWVEGHAAALGHWSADERAGLLEVVARAEVLLDELSRTCLVHSDLNPKNVLVDPESLEVTGLVDWEYCHSGSPVTDLGNLVRFDREPDYVDAVLSAYSARLGGAADDLLDLARSADLWALVDLAARRRQNPVAGRAHDLLLAIAGARDLHAWPAGWTLRGRHA